MKKARFEVTLRNPIQIYMDRDADTDDILYEVIRSLSTDDFEVQFMEDIDDVYKY